MGAWNFEVGGAKVCLGPPNLLGNSNILVSEYPKNQQSQGKIPNIFLDDEFTSSQNTLI